MEREFNLIDAPWIRVRMADCGIREVSLRDALLCSHTFTGLAGETKTQDFAVLRMMLAVLYTVFSRYDADGNDIDLDEDPSLALENWKSIWDAGRLPAAPIERYFSEWHDRFWLFDAKYPFYQTNAVKGKSECATAKMIGTLFESNNKARLFSDRNQNGRYLTYGESARWLLHLNQFDDIAAKQPTPKRTWCGKLSLIALIGDNLFQTLMLNYRADYDANKGKQEHPAWETDRQKAVFNQEIAVPDNQAALLTLQSRNLYLCAENGSVSAYKLAGGDWFVLDDVPDEQMTLWSGFQDKKAPHPEFKPKRYDSSKQIWQEFSGISALSVQQRDAQHFERPAGIVEWLNELLKYGLVDRDYRVNLCTAAIIYDFKQATSLPVIDAVSDTLTFHAGLLEDISAQWRRAIIAEIGKIDKAAAYVYLLYKKLQTAGGRRDKDQKESQSGEQDAKQDFYAKVDRDFRRWLAMLEPDSDRDAYIEQLEYTLRRITVSYGRELVGQIGPQAIFVNKEMSAASALNWFEGSVNQLFSAAKNHQSEVNHIVHP